ncbi:MAG: DNA-formamidopyrimidine glycosylase family protein, partial [Dermatophilaceae bacterium]
MPELPEVEALVEFLRERTKGQAIVGIELGSISVLKTYDPAPASLHGLPIGDVTRHGKFIDIEAEGLHLVFHLARAGWLRWSDALASTTIRPGKSPIALRCRLSDGSGFDLTEAGTQKRLAAYIVRDPSEVPGVAHLGPDPMGQDFTLADFTALLEGRRTQVKGLLKDQGFLAGVGNAYSDEVLHAARLSPFALASALDEEEVQRLYAALRGTLAEAVSAASGKPA